MTTGLSLPAKNRRPARRKAVTVLVTALTAGLLSWGYYWHTHPDFITPGGGFTAGYPHAPLDVAFSVGAGIVTASNNPTNEADTHYVPVTLLKVAPIITENTADSDITVTLCANKPGGGFNGGGSYSGPISAICAWTRPPEGVRTILGYDHPNLLITITPRRAGTSTVSGLSITYKRGWQKGTVTSGPVATITAPG